MSNDDISVNVPDDLSGIDLTGSADGIWQIHERLVLCGGETMVRLGAALPFEPYLGDVMDTSGFRIEQTLSAAREDGVLRWLPDDDGVFFTPIENVHGIFIDIFGPNGEDLHAAQLKPGRHQPNPNT